MTPSAASDSSDSSSSSSSSGEKPSTSCRSRPSPRSSRSSGSRNRRTQKNRIRSSGHTSGGSKSCTSPKKCEEVVEKAIEDTNNNHGCCEADGTETDVEEDYEFPEHLQLNKRVAKSLYFANKLPVTPRPSLPLTVLAVNSFTKGSYLSQFDSLEFLDIELASEISRNACVSPTTLIMALVYLERLANNNPKYLHTVNSNELFVVSLMVASKFFQDTGEDVGVYSDEWSASSRIDLKRLNELELNFLFAIDWKLNIEWTDFYKVFNKVENKLALDEGMKRGWFNYTEMQSLSNSILTWTIVWPIINDYFLKVISAAALCYSALLATVLSTTVFGPYFFIISKHLLLTSTSLTSTSISISTLPAIASTTNESDNQLLYGRRNNTNTISDTMLTEDDLEHLNNENETTLDRLLSILSLKDFSSSKNYYGIETKKPLLSVLHLNEWLKEKEYCSNPPSTTETDKIFYNYQEIDIGKQLGSYSVWKGRHKGTMNKIDFSYSNIY